MKNLTKEFQALLKIDSNIKKLLIVTAVVFAAMGFLTRGTFFSAANWRAMAFQMPELGFFALAMTFVIISGGIDLSVVSIANLSGICAAFLMRSAVQKNIDGTNLVLLIVLVFVIAIAIGIAAGLFNGMLISVFKVSPILATLGAMNLFTGIGIIVTRGEAVSGFPNAYLELGNGAILGMPLSLLLFVILFVFSYLLLNKTKFGFDLRFFGSNPRASYYTGINNRSVLLKTYIYSGIVSAIIGLEFIARTNSAKADYGSTYVFSSILCVILGGINPMGGSGSLVGVLLALVSLQFLSSGFNMLRLTGTIKELAWGLLLLAVMSVNYLILQRQMKQKMKEN